SVCQTAILWQTDAMADRQQRAPDPSRGQAGDRAMKLAANLSLLYPGLPLQARMQQAARDGFLDVEILFPYDVAPQTLAAQLRRHGLNLILVNTPLGPDQEKGLACLPGRQAEFLQGVERALDICRHTG